MFRLIVALSFLFFALPVSAQTQTQTKRALTIEHAHGVENWNSVKRVKFTWTHNGSGTSRAYDWDRTAKTVTVTMGEKSVTIPTSGKGLKGEELEAHKGFINDSYWLLFEVYISIDDVTITHLGKQDIPMLGGSSAALSVQYKDGGYTPGDKYVLYEKYGLVVAWAFHPGGAEEPKLVTTREAHKDFGGLKVPTEFKTADGKSFISISNVSIE